MLLSLVQNLDVFAWSLYEVPGVDQTFITHKLNMDPLFPQEGKNQGDLPNSVWRL